MSICIVAATALELQNFPSSDQFDVLITGVGTAATVYHLTKKSIDQNRPSSSRQVSPAASMNPFHWAQQSSFKKIGSQISAYMNRINGKMFLI